MAEKRYYVLDSETGEIRNDCTVRTPEQQKVIQMEEVKKRVMNGGRAKNHFVFGKVDSIHEIIYELSLIEAGTIVKLLPFMSYHNGMLKKKHKPMTRKDIENVLNRNKSSVHRILKSLMNRHILYISRDEKDKRKYTYHFNPDFFIRGKIKTKEFNFIKIYQNTINQQFDFLTLEEFGFLFKIIPYFNKHYYMITLNPNETDPKKIHILNTEMLSKLIKVHRNTTSKMLKKMRDRGLIIKTEGAKGVTGYLVNPKLMTKLNPIEEFESENFSVVTRIFETHESSTLPEV